MYVVGFTTFGKRSWFSLRLAQQATHDNPLCFVKTVNANKNCHTSATSKLVAWQEASVKRTDARLHLTRWYGISLLGYKFTPPSKEFHTHF